MSKQLKIDAIQINVSTCNMAKKNFSLIELLVVVGVIGILAGMLMPALAMARARAVETALLNRTKQFNLASFLYRDADENSNFLLNRKNGGSIGVDFDPLRLHGFVDGLSEDSFRTTALEDDLTLSSILSVTQNDFHPTGRGLLYFNFSSKDSGIPILTLATFNTKFGYELPEDTEYVIVGVGMNGKLDLYKPEDDFVFIKRASNGNSERWPTR